MARGDYTVMIAGRAHALEAYPQAPLKWIAPAEGSVVVPIAMTMIKGAPHPNAARLWANHLLRPDIQSSFSTTVLPVMKNAAIKSPLVSRQPANSSKCCRPVKTGRNTMRTQSSSTVHNEA